MSNDDRGPTGQEGFETAAERSDGNPWVVHGLNALLSVVFAATVIWGLDFLGATEFTPISVATFAVILFTISYVASLR